MNKRLFQTKYTTMKNLLILMISLLLVADICNAQCNINPTIQQGDINPAPLVNDYADIQFSYFENGATYSDLNDPIKVEIEFHNLEPINGGTLVYGTAGGWFNWQYDSTSNKLTGTQNQTINFSSGGLVNVSAIVTDTIACPTNQTGYNVDVILPSVCPPYSNPMSVYTCYDVTKICALGSILTSTNGLTVDFSFSNPIATNVTWDFGDGNTGTGLNPSHTYAQNKVYLISAISAEGTGPCNYSTFVDLNTCYAELNVDSPISCPGEADGALTAIMAGGQPPYNYVWTTGETNQTITGLAAGIHAVTVTDALTCVKIMFHLFEDPTLNASITGLSATFDISAPLPSGTTYLWDFDDGNTSTAIPPITHTYAQGGQYTPSVVTTNPVTLNACTFQTNVQIQFLCVDSSAIDSNIPCSNQFIPVCGCDSITYLNDCVAENHFGLSSWTNGQCQGACSGVITTIVNGTDVAFNLTGVPTGISFYNWSFGDGNSSALANPTHSYALSGIYNISLIVLDSALNQCTYYTTIQAGTGTLCIDATLIDLGANCPGYNPVCGCNGITYNNACIAEKCFGVSSMTNGPCATPQDSTCTTSTTFTYTDMQTPTGHDVSFFGSGTGIGNLTYYWDFGDGFTATGINTTHTYSDTTSLDSLQVFNVCLAVLDSAQCVATYCETIVVLVNPNGNIAGGVYEGSNFTGPGGVSTGKTGSGDPMPNVTVHLERADGLILATDVTNALGIYEFDLLQFGHYNIRVDIPGITHAGEAVKLSPILQSIPSLDFEVDDDGTVTAAVQDLSLVNSFGLTPNPANDLVTLEINALESHTTALQVINLTGQAVYKEQITLQKGIQTHQIELQDWPNGIYFIVLQSGNGIISKKLIRH